MDIFSLIILFAVGSMIARFFKKIGQSSKQAQTQAQTEATKQQFVQAPVPKATPKPADYRFPSIQQPSSPKQPLYEEGRDPNTVMKSDLSDYRPITPSGDLDVMFSDFKGSLDTARSEGTGYKPEEYDDVSTAYQSNARIEAKILPEAFNRNALIQAVVMSEILKRPGASKR